MRKRGSCRFEPYFKVQWFHPLAMAWRDVQRTYPTEDEAREAFLPSRDCRVMRITENGRTPL
jgi:hypothetical protein